MDVLKAIRERRSIRKFKSDPVPDKILHEIIEAGMLAPSAGNLQSRKFIVLKGNAKKKFQASASGRFQLGDEPVLIVVCADKKAIEKYGERGIELYTKLDCAASIMNMMLAAHAHGLGTCWVGSFDEETVRRELRLPENLRPISIIPLGFPAEKPERPQRKSMDEACEFLE